MDLSCGSGLFTRRFVKSDQFQGVIAADYSETMLQQTRQLFNQEVSLDRRCGSHIPCMMTASSWHSVCAESKPFSETRRGRQALLKLALDAGSWDLSE